jgi:hypothetical protein
MNQLCENGIYQNDGICHSLKCKIINDNCVFIRWCVTSSGLKMTPLAEKCKYRGEVMEKTKSKIKETVDLENNNNDEIINDYSNDELIFKQEVFQEDKIDSIEIKKQLCKVIFIKNNKLMLNFQGYGIEIILDDNFDKINIGNEILVKYESEIGKADFKAYLAFE